MHFVLFLVMMVFRGFQCHVFERVCDADCANAEVNGTIAMKVVVSEFECASMCSETPTCNGYNFLQTTNPDTVHNCELLNVWSSCSETVPRTGWKFFIKVSIHYLYCIF